MVCHPMGSSLKKKLGHSYIANRSVGVLSPPQFSSQIEYSGTYTYSITVLKIYVDELTRYHSFSIVLPIYWNRVAGEFRSSVPGHLTVNRGPRGERPVSGRRFAEERCRGDGRGSGKQRPRGCQWFSEALHR